MALAYPIRTERYIPGPAQGLALMAFVLFYVLLGALRFETGGDWLTYGEMFDEIQSESLLYAVTTTDPLYGVINWMSAQLGTGIYLVNGICCFVLGYGAVRAALTTREPWLALLIAVPYLLIVVGLGYVRQGAAIGVILIAISSIDRSRPLRTIVYLVIATLLHSSAAMAVPLFGYALIKRNRAFAIVAMVVGALMFVTLLAPRLNQFEIGYIDTEYESSGAGIRLLMGLVPSLLILARYRRFASSARTRSIWIAISIANLMAGVALLISASSTLVDRVALYFSIVQLAAFGDIRDLLGISNRMTFFLRILLIAIAAAVQTVWLVYATHSIYWVPYQSILQNL
ncbi:MAG TPA: EpsG family protein [Novosphingobium sp.]|nr:EpsG family protein [Novosphingobium sp.]